MLILHWNKGQPFLSNHLSFAGEKFFTWSFFLSIYLYNLWTGDAWRSKQDKQTFFEASNCGCEWESSDGRRHIRAVVLQFTMNVKSFIWTRVNTGNVARFNRLPRRYFFQVNTFGRSPGQSKDKPQRFPQPLGLLVPPSPPERTVCAPCEAAAPASWAKEQNRNRTLFPR